MRGTVGYSGDETVHLCSRSWPALIDLFPEAEEEKPIAQLQNKTSSCLSFDL